MPIIELKEGPTVLTPPSTSAQDARARAIAKLTQGPTPPAAAKAPNSQEHPVANPSKISPEESSVVQNPSKIEGKDEQGQKSTSDTADKLEAKADKEEPLSSQFALLARKEKALRAKVQAQDAAIKAREQALLAKEAELKTKEASYSSDFVPKSKLTEDPLSVLAEIGIDYDALTQLVLNRPQMDPTTKAYLQKLEAQVKAQADVQEKGRLEAAEAQKAQYQQAVNQIRNEAKALVQKDASYETIKETGSVDQVVELIEETFKADGILLTVEEAAQEVENYLVEEALKLSRIEKIRKRLMPKEEPKPEAAQASAPEKQESQKSQPKPTLTNSIGVNRTLSPRERAILAFQGKLNQS